MNGGTPLKWVLSPWVGRPIYIHIRTGKPKEFSNSKGLLHFRGVRVSLTKASLAVACKSNQAGWILVKMTAGPIIYKALRLSVNCLLPRKNFQEPKKIK